MSNIKQQKNGKISFALVFAGLIFFFNPCINMLDVIPDFIGAILIYAGLRKQALADGYFEDARKLSFYMIWMYIIKLVFTFMVLDDPRNALPFTFISSVLELIVLFSFVRKLFSGFEYTLMRTTAVKDDTCNNIDKNSKKSRFATIANVPLNEAYVFVMFFVVAKCVLVFVPELFELFTQGVDMELSVNASYYMSLAGVKKYAVLLSIFLQFILGIMFIYYLGKFFMALKKHPSYYSDLCDKYLTEIKLNRDKYVNKTLAASYLLALASVIFIVDFYLEGMDLFMDIFTPLLFALSVAVIGRIGTYVKLPWTAVVLLGISCVANTALMAYTGPEYYSIMVTTSADITSFEMHSNGFFDSLNCVIIYGAAGIMFIASVVYAVVMWIKSNREIYIKELMGNHDRKLLTVGILVSASAVVKSVLDVTEAFIAYVAGDPAVHDFISDRAVLTEKRMAQRIAASEDVALFCNLENLNFTLNVVAAVLVVFAVFNIFALRTEVTREE